MPSCKPARNPFRGFIAPNAVIEQPITMRRLSAYFFRQFTDLGRGFWHTIIMLFRNPGKVIRDYIGGSTVRYAHPLRYLLLWITVSFLIFFG